MNLTKLFEIQAGLDKHIVKEKGLEGQDLLDMKILALQVELGELANEWRGFKFWKVNPKPRTEEWVECSACDGTGDLNYEMVQEEAEGSGGHEYIDCEECDSAGTIGTRNPLLEEYVDCLHFILSIGNDLKCELEELEPGHFPTISETLINLIRDPAELKYDVRDGIYEEFIVTYTDMFELFLGLGSQLGFTWEQIEQAYFDKNKINHERQNNGY